LIPALILPFTKDNFDSTKQQGSFKGTTMFVDISGFTPLTEALMQHGTDGAEILSEILDSIFKPLVAQVSAQGGIIPHFAGDAFTAIFEGEKTEIVAHIAENIKNFFDNTPYLKTRFGDFTIQVRIGLSYGIVDWGILNVSFKNFYFKGSAIERATLAQQKALPQQIIKDEWFENVEATDLATEPHIFQQINLPIKEGKSEFREAVAVFLSFSNANSHAALEALASIVLKSFETFGGYFKELDFSEKEGIWVGFFGAPVAFENNGARALECVLAIKEAALLYNVNLRCGMAAGIAYTGMIGGVERMQYAVVGNRVNLAARLLKNAAWGEIFVDKTLAQTRSFDFKDMGALRYKGIAQIIPTFLLLHKRLEEKAFFSGTLFGREEELKQLSHFIDQCFYKNQTGIATIYGEAGIGKSRLSYELQQILSKNTAFRWVKCPTDQTLRKPFNPFVYFLKTFFNQQADNFTDHNKRVFEEKLNEIFQSINTSETNFEGQKTQNIILKNDVTEGDNNARSPLFDVRLEAQNTKLELERTQSILAALMGLHYPDSLWEQLDAKGRYDNTWAALSNFFIVLAHNQPLVIEVEDAHWLDDDSKVFLTDFIKKIGQQSIILLFTSRYDDEGNKFPFFDTHFIHENDIVLHETDLNVFTKEQLTHFTKDKLNAPANADLLETLWRTSNGNPFYVEQILDYFNENNILQYLDNEWIIADRKVKISTSISAIVTARIDRLSSLLKETVKAAAVIGREFELPVLAEILLSQEAYQPYKNKGNLILQEQIVAAEKGQIWQAMNELRYIFRHALLREAIYDMQLKTHLRQLHAQTARALEKIYADRLDDRFFDLAFHYEQAEDKPKTCEYLKKAADQARRNFQNQQALELYDRLLNLLTEKGEIIKINIRKGEVLQLIGQWQLAEKCFKKALTDAEKIDAPLLKGRANDALGTLLMLKGHYKEARYELEKAANYFEQAIDFQGIIKVYGNLGNLYFRQGDYEKATDYFKQSIRFSLDNDRLINPQIVSNLGLTYMNLGNFTEGVRVQEDALSLCEKNNDVVGMSILSVNLGIVLTEKGDTDAALKQLEQGLALAQKLGNQQLTSIALGCIGNIWLTKGDFEKAEQHLVQDLAITETLGDRQGIAIASELMGRLYAAKGNFEESLTYSQASLSLCRTLNYQKGIAKALLVLGNIHLAQQLSEQALGYFNEALNIAQKINNKLILQYALVEKNKILQQNRYTSPSIYFISETK
jgi:tetratricopeptide (TPR) repeat protein/class 3 adenylate cyclase